MLVESLLDRSSLPFQRSKVDSPKGLLGRIIRTAGSGRRQFSVGAADANPNFSQPHRKRLPLLA